MSGHLLKLHRGWSLWSDLCLRGAGFPAQGVLALAADEAACLLDEVVTIEAEIERLNRRIIASLQRAISDAAPDARKPFRKTLKTIAGSKLPATGAEGISEADLAELSGAHARLANANERLTAALQNDDLRTRKVLRSVAADPRFREALLWQNPDALKRAVDVLANSPVTEADTATRRRERLVASYFQRYSVKNDSISFFGPFGWGQAVSADTPVNVRPGPSLLARRSVYFEFWALEAIVARIAEDGALKPWLLPRRSPAVRVEGSTLIHSQGQASELPDEYAWLLSRANGQARAVDLARQMIAAGTFEVQSEADVYALLEELVENKLLLWALEIPTYLERPELELRRILNGVEDSAVRDAAVAKLDAVDLRREAVAQAAGEPAALERAFVELYAAFAELTGQQGSRRGGETYAGRTPVFEDCRRHLELEVGGSVVKELGPPLALLLQSARWCTEEIARRYESVFSTQFEALRTETGAEVIEYAQFFARIQDHFVATQYETPEIVTAVHREVHRKWAAILDITPEQHRVQIATADIEARVAEAFPSSAPGWPMARFHSPDVMIAAASVDHIRAGDYQLVLGELHPGCNSMMAPSIVFTHPEPRDLVQAYERDIPVACVAPLVPKEKVHLAQYAPPSRLDVHMETGGTKSWRPRSHVVGAGELVVTRNGTQQLVVRTADGRWEFDALAFFEMYIVIASVGHFHIIESMGNHTPRISIGRLVIARERWRFEPAELPFLALESRLEPFVAAYRWARKIGLPRFVFVKTPEEPKPFFLDFHSPVFVELFVKMARHASAITITEMVPDVTQAWLPDAEGQRYTSELRLAVCDDVPFPRPTGIAR